jgi:hypothetical protein
VAKWLLIIGARCNNGLVLEGNEPLLNEVALVQVDVNLVCGPVLGLARAEVIKVPHAYLPISGHLVAHWRPHDARVTAAMHAKFREERKIMHPIQVVVPASAPSHDCSLS